MYILKVVVSKTGVETTCCLQGLCLSNVSFIFRMFILSLFRLACGTLFNVSKLVFKGVISLISVFMRVNDREMTLTELRVYQ